LTCGEQSLIIQEKESTFIPLGEKHRLSILCNEVLEIIKVQSGGHQGEDDTVRIDDGYGRN
jgi:mannose-1-phosphate guanylyltransferase / mannose-6-phosphate isomerase